MYVCMYVYIYIIHRNHTYVQVNTWVMFAVVNSGVIKNMGMAPPKTPNLVSLERATVVGAYEIFGCVCMCVCVCVCVYVYV